MFNRVRRWLTLSNLKRAAIPISFGVVIYFLYFWQLGSLTPGLSAAEVIARNSSSDLQPIIDNPVNAPHRLVQFGLQQLSSEVLLLRLSSVIFMLVFLATFYFLIKLWFGRFIATLSSFILITSPLLIVAARSAQPAIMFLAPLAIITEFLWLSRRKRYINLTWLFFTATVAVSLYVPGVIWFVLIAAAIKWKDLAKLAQSVNGWVSSLSMLIFLVLVTPLAVAVTKEPSIARPLLLIPEHLPGVVSTLQSIGWSALSLIWRLPYTTDLTVGRLPLLTFAQIAMSAFGLYAMFNKARRETIELLAIFTGSILLAGLNTQLLLLIPAILVVCIFTAAGLRYLYVEWNSIFPRNPLPKSLAVALMTILVGVQLIYGWRYALVAWPHTPATNTTYVIE